MAVVMMAETAWDRPHREMEIRKELTPKLRETRANGKMVYLVYDRVIIKDRMD